MAKNIEIQINNGNNSYEILYPKVDLTNNQGSQLSFNDISGNLDYSRIENIVNYCNCGRIDYEGSVDKSTTTYETLTLNFPSVSKLKLFVITTNSYISNNYHNYFFTPVWVALSKSGGTSSASAFIYTQNSSTGNSHLDNAVFGVDFAITKTVNSVSIRCRRQVQVMVPYTNELVAEVKSISANCLNTVYTDYIVIYWYQ